MLGKVYIYIENLRNPRYNLPNYFTPNGDDFNDYFLIKYENILEEDLSFEVKVMDRYQRIVYEGLVQGSDKIWNAGLKNNNKKYCKLNRILYLI